jgi:hypothetical protein
VWCRWSPWRGSYLARPLELVLDGLDLDLGPLAVVCVIVGLPLLFLAGAEQLLRLALTPVAVLVRTATRMAWPVEISVGFFRREKSLILAPDQGSAAVVRDATAHHLRTNGDLADPVFQQWLTDRGAVFVPDRRRRSIRRIARELRTAATGRR